jgi:hypothetical protein
MCRASVHYSTVGCNEVVGKFLADFGTRPARQTGPGCLPVTPYCTVKAVIMIIDLTKYFFDFHQGLDITFVHVSHPVARDVPNDNPLRNNDARLTQRIVKQRYNPLKAASQRQDGDKIGNIL